MPEMPDAREDHRQIVLVGGGDDFGVADGAAGLDDGGDAVPGRLVEAVADGEELVGGERGALDWKLHAHRADADGIDARHLARADADRLARARVDDGVRLRVLAARPGEEEGRELFAGLLA